MLAPRKSFDGYGADNAVMAQAFHIINAAIADEIAHSGAAVISETLACFLEFRIAEALEERLS